MRSQLIRLLLVSFFVAMTVAQLSPNTTASDLLTMMPDCTVPCTTKTLFKEGGCPETNAGEISKCACTNVSLQRRLSTCVQKNCRFDDQVKFSQSSNAICKAYPKASRVNELKVTAIVTITLSIPFLFLRLYSRWLNNRLVSADEAYTVIAAAFLIVLSVLTLRMSLMGFGLHYWNIPPEHGVALLKYWYVCQMMYIMVQIFSKVAILSLYSRLFGDQRNWFRWVVHGMIAFMFIHGLVFFLLVTFQCIPIEAIWNKLIHGKCLPLNYAIGFTGACMSIAEDVIILILPIPQLWRLQMCLKKKIGLVLLLSIGSFACLTSIIRLKFILEFSNSYDSTWDNVDVVKWSVIEALAACICGNLMALRPLVDRIMPTIRSVVSPYPWRLRQSCKKTPSGLESHGCSDNSDAFANSKVSTNSDCTELNEMTQSGSRDDDERRLVVL
ncbi:hypothetical protein P3342_008953 [Pyrenophora teres f. teres]|nr:hypothetical protein P3342_008953 [Pyrenophora teres f. teres]